MQAGRARRKRQGLGARSGDTSDRIFLAAALDPGAFDAELGFLIQTT
jgi:hypothetical protein